ncbi:MAG: DUF2079 domain-containing protein [Bacteroidetes bacterium]|nr:DUF2079 domain-containing protein [Bacteroidota bacterium]
MKFFQAHKNLLIVIAFFAIIYSLISIVNHYYFRTYALDLGAYTNALYDYIRFQWNDSTVFREVGENLLADHFDLYLIIFSPLSLIFGSYALLIVQIAFILLGGVGIYKYFLLSEKTSRYALSATIYFYLFFGVISALSFDYHSNTIAAALLPWFFYWMKKRKVLACSMMLLAILVSKENISLWMAFVCLGLLVEYWKKPFWRYYLLLAFSFCILYFVLITMVVMPAISNKLAYPHFHYSFLGSNPSEALLFLLEHPIESFKTLFINHTNHPNGDYVKLEFLLLLLVSGLYIVVRKPAYFIMLIPLFFQKFYHDNISMWGISAQYSVEFAPVLAIGIFAAISEIKGALLRKILLVLSLGGCLLATTRIMDHTMMYTDKSRIRIYQSMHYTRDYDVKKVHEALSVIPPGAIVSAQSPFVPHLALRDNIYQFPIIKDAEYIVISAREGPYPLSKEAFAGEIDKLKASGDWEVLYWEDGFYIFRRADRSAEF